MRDYSLLIMILVAVVFMAIAVMIGAADSAKWQAFAKTHDCKLIGKSEGYMAYGFSSNGKMNNYYVPGRETYHCNDGVDYTR